MKAELFRILDEIRASYWFWPSVMAVSAIGLALATTQIDASFETDWPEKLPFVYSNQPDGARALLATVAGSMITVTGITFSLTLLAVSHATSQFGPRLLTNFMRDRGNQFTLGTFIATFLYCLMVLRTVRSAEQPPPQSEAMKEAAELAGAFVPHLSVFIALLLTLSSVGVLIYFIHHIPESIRLSNVVAEIGRELLATIDKLFPETIGRDPPQETSEILSNPSRDPRLDLPDHFVELAQPIEHQGHGYLQALDESGLMSAAVEYDLILRLRARPGDFVSLGQPLLLAWPSERVNQQVQRRLQAAFARGHHRTAHQNAMYLVDQLVEVAARALSPGVNDPMTAISCLDWLQSVLLTLAARQRPQSYRYDAQGHLRIVADAAGFEEYCRAIFDQLRPYVAADRNAALHSMRVLHTLRASVADPQYRELLNHHADLLIQAAEHAQMFEPDVQELRKLEH